MMLQYIVLGREITPIAPTLTVVSGGGSISCRSLIRNRAKVLTDQVDEILRDDDRQFGLVTRGDVTERSHVPDLVEVGHLTTRENEGFGDLGGRSRPVEVPKAISAGFAGEGRPASPADQSVKN